MRLAESPLTYVAIEAIANSLPPEQASPSRCIPFARNSSAGADPCQINESGFVRQAGPVRKLLVDSLVSIVLLLVSALLLAATFGKLGWFNPTAGSTCLHHHSRSAESFVELKTSRSTLPATN